MVKVFNNSVSGEAAVTATTIVENRINAGLNNQGVAESVVNKIWQYVKDYDGIMLDNDGSNASIFMGWNNFTDVEKDYAMEYDYVVGQHTRYYLSEDDIPVKEVFVDEWGVTAFVRWKVDVKREMEDELRIAFNQYLAETGNTVDSMDARDKAMYITHLRNKFNAKMHFELENAFNEYVKYVREFTDDFNPKKSCGLTNGFRFKRNWMFEWETFINNISPELTMTAKGYYARFSDSFINDNEVKELIEYFAIRLKVRVNFVIVADDNILAYVTGKINWRR